MSTNRQLIEQNIREYVAKRDAERRVIVKKALNEHDWDALEKIPGYASLARRFRELTKNDPPVNGST